MPRPLTWAVLVLTLFLVSAKAGVSQQLKQGWNEAILISMDDSVKEEREVDAEMIDGSTNGTLRTRTVFYPYKTKQNIGYPQNITLIQIFAGKYCPKGRFANVIDGGVGSRFLEINFNLEKPLSKNNVCKYILEIRIADPSSFKYTKEQISKQLITKEERKMVAKSCWFCFGRKQQQEKVFGWKVRENDVFKTKKFTIDSFYTYLIDYISVDSSDHCSEKEFASIVLGGLRKEYVIIRFKLVGPVSVDEYCFYTVTIYYKK